MYLQIIPTNLNFSIYYQLVKSILAFTMTMLLPTLFVQSQSQEIGRQSRNTSCLYRNLYIMLKVIEWTKTPGITSKNTWISLKGTSCLQVILLIISMKETLIWFNLQRDTTGNGLSNIKDTFTKSLQLQSAVLHQSMCISQVVLVSQVHMMAGKK